MAKQLCHPLIGHAGGTEASSRRGSQIVKRKVRDLRSSEGLLPNGLQLYLVSGRIQIAREWKRSVPRNCQLISESINGKRREWYLSDSVRSLGVQNPNDCVWKVQLVFLHGHEFLADPKTGLRDDPRDIPQVWLGV